MKTTTGLLAAALALTGAAAMAQPYKCKDPQGRVVYQQAPCPQGEKVNIAGAGVGDPDSGYVRQARIEGAQADRARAIADNNVVAGMTRDDVLQVWGQPVQVNRAETPQGTFEEWMFRRGGVTRYVVIGDGRVSEVHTSERLYRDRDRDRDRDPDRARTPGGKASEPRAGEAPANSGPRGLR